MDKPITIKTALTSDELRRVADYFLDFADDGNRPHIYTPVAWDALVERVREVREAEKKRLG